MSSETGPTITSPIVMGGEAPSVDSPVVQDNPAPPVVADPVVDPNAPAPVVDPAAAKPNANTTPEWAQKRINELTAKRYEAERTAQAATEKAAVAEAKAAELLAKMAGGQPPVADPNAKPAVTIGEDEIERRAVQKAEAMAAANEFNRACNNIVEAGKKEFGTVWDDAVKNLTMVGAIGQGAPLDFLETAIELKNPAAVLAHLGGNLEEAERVAKLPAKRMALEMARIEAQLTAPKPAPAAPVVHVSGAPAPVIPVGGTAGKPPALDINDPHISTADFMRIRSEQREEKMRGYRKA